MCISVLLLSFIVVGLRFGHKWGLICVAMGKSRKREKTVRDDKTEERMKKRRKTKKDIADTHALLVHNPLT